MIKTVKQKLKKHFHEIMKIKKSEHSIALGFAIGTFISILPTPGFNLLLGMVVVLIYKKINKISLFSSMAVWNTLTMMPLYILSYKLGDLIFGNAPVVKYKIELINQIYNYSRRYLVGNFVVAASVSILSYFVLKYIVRLYRKRKKKSF